MSTFADVRLKRSRGSSADRALLDFIVKLYEKYWAIDGVSEHDFLGLFLDIKPPYIKTLNPTDTIKVATELIPHIQKYIGVTVELPAGFEPHEGVCESIWPARRPQRAFSRPRLRSSGPKPKPKPMPKTKWRQPTFCKEEELRLSKAAFADKPVLLGMLASICAERDETAYTVVAEIMGPVFVDNYDEVNELPIGMLRDTVNALLIRKAI